MGFKVGHRIIHVLDKIEICVCVCRGGATGLLLVLMCMLMNMCIN